LEPKDYHWTCHRPAVYYNGGYASVAGWWWRSRLTEYDWRGDCCFSFGSSLRFLRSYSLALNDDFFVWYLSHRVFPLWSRFQGNPYCPPPHIVHMSEGLLYCIRIWYKNEHLHKTPLQEFHFN
jgi:hypothetical protein